MVSYDLGYSFFYHLLTVPRRMGVAPGVGDSSPDGANAGVGGEGGGEILPEGQRRRRRRRRQSEAIHQEVEMSFRVAQLRSGVLLSSWTSSSHHHLVTVSHFTRMLLSWLPS